jgi:small multidrug resistance family-3 protein
VTVTRSVALFVLAALAEIGGAWLVWQGVRESRGWAWIAAGVVALGIYGFVATLQPDAHFGRILAAYGASSSWAPGVGHGARRVPSPTVTTSSGA